MHRLTIDARTISLESFKLRKEEAGATKEKTYINRQMNVLPHEATHDSVGIPEFTNDVDPLGLLLLLPDPHWMVGSQVAAAQDVNSRVELASLDGLFWGGG